MDRIGHCRHSQKLAELGLLLRIPRRVSRVLRNIKDGIVSKYLELLVFNLDSAQYGGLMIAQP